MFAPVCVALGIKQNVPWTGKSCLQCPRSRQRTVLEPSLCLTLWLHMPSSLWWVGGNCACAQGKDRTLSSSIGKSESAFLPLYETLNSSSPCPLCRLPVNGAWCELAMWSASVKRATYLFYQMQPCQKVSSPSEILGRRGLQLCGHRAERRIPIYPDSHQK